MSTTTPNFESVTDARTVDRDRYIRACTETMNITAHAPKMYDVENGNGVVRTVDLEGGSCECSDHEYRGDRFYCKHVIASAVYHAFVEGVNTQLVARVVQAARKFGCTHGHDEFCEGPLGVGTFPCSEDVAASRTGDWTVYKRLIELSEAGQ